MPCNIARANYRSVPKNVMHWPFECDRILNIIRVLMKKSFFVSLPIRWGWRDVTLTRFDPVTYLSTLPAKSHNVDRLFTSTVTMVSRETLFVGILLIIEGSIWVSEGFEVSITLPISINRKIQARSHNPWNKYQNNLRPLLHTTNGNVLLVHSQPTYTNQLDNIAQEFSRCLQQCQNEITKTCRVKIAPVPGTGHRLGLIATESIPKSSVALSIPFDDRYELNGKTKTFKGYLPESYDSWTGEAGIIALQILNEVALCADGTTAGIQIPNRSLPLQEFMKSWALALPGPTEMKDNPLMWSEDHQEILQSSTTNKIYKLLDDIEEDATWLTEHVFDKDRSRFPEKVMWNEEMIPCFSVEGYKWAIALSRSRSFFLDGTLRLIPFLDMCNHSDDGIEVGVGYMGTFNTIKGAEIVTSKSCNVGDEVLCSYGPKSAADYLLEYGFCPDQCWSADVSEITLEVDPEDRFYDDKIDILEHETYDQAPMGPQQSFDVVSAQGRDGEPDKAMIQFARLCVLGSNDAFLLESIFRQECWGFMELPVSEKNELDVITMITEACEKAMADFSSCPEGGPVICSKLRESETKALTRTVEYLQREKEALDLKEYYQERRLKELGLDSTWSPEDDMDPERVYGQSRSPGGADYDW
jgi:[ribulose-bisphosphate carboxylase]/[fructose-bisphosphate aldolase]-lysine N-methyltransferase